MKLAVISRLSSVAVPLGLVALFATGSLLAQPATIKVLVVYTDKAKQSTGSNIAAHAATNIDAMNAQLEASGLAGVAQVVLAGAVDDLVDGGDPPEAYDENDPNMGNGTYVGVAQDVTANAGTYKADGKTITELRTETQADMVFVVSDTNAPCCGGANAILIGTEGDYQNYVAAVHPGNAQTVIDDDWLHELAHLAGARHSDTTYPTPGGAHEQ